MGQIVTWKESRQGLGFAVGEMPALQRGDFLLFGRLFGIAVGGWLGRLV